MLYYNLWLGNYCYLVKISFKNVISCILNQDWGTQCPSEAMWFLGMGWPVAPELALGAQWASEAMLFLGMLLWTIWIHSILLCTSNILLLFFRFLYIWWIIQHPKHCWKALNYWLQWCLDYANCASGQIIHRIVSVIS
jgi:hypothetical protein